VLKLWIELFSRVTNFRARVVKTLAQAAEFLRGVYLVFIVLYFWTDLKNFVTAQSLFHFKRSFTRNTLALF